MTITAGRTTRPPDQPEMTIKKPAAEGQQANDILVRQIEDDETEAHHNAPCLDAQTRDQQEFQRVRTSF